MESNLPVIAKRVWSIVRVVLFMLRKGISKGKIIMDLNMMMLKRRRKLAGKVISNLMFNHHHSGSTSGSRSHDSSITFSAPREYEFSCSNTPNNYFFPIAKRNRNHNHNHFFACAHAPPTQDDEVVTVKAVLDMLNNEVMVEASPALPAGFGRSPMLRQLRVTDSPFPLQNADDKDHHVDKAAEEFIKRFYKQLRNQIN